MSERAKCWLPFSVLMSLLQLFLSCLRQQMAKTAEVLQAERKLRLAQRVQNTPQSWYTNTKDCRVNFKEILHRSCKLCLWKKDFMLLQSTALFPPRVHHFLHVPCTQLFLSCKLTQKSVTQPCVGQVLGDSFAEIESLGMPEHFCEDELLFILNSDKR